MAAALLLALLALQGSALLPPRTSPRRTTPLRAVSFSAPLVDDGYASPSASQPALLVYLPGFDGNALAPFLQWPALHDAGFDVRCAAVDAADRSTFEDLAAACAAYVDAERRGRPALLVGESFGGALAVAVAGRAAVDGVVLVNPATCYGRSNLARDAPRVSRLPAFLYPFGLLSLLPLFIDRHGLPALVEIVSSRRLPCVIDTPRREAYQGRIATTLPGRLPFMPRGTLDWRLREWLDVAARVDVDDLSLPTLVVYGDDDRTLPSADEAARVVAALTSRGVRAAAHRVPGAGHAGTLGSRVDLRAAVAAFFGAEGDTPLAEIVADVPREMRADAREPGEDSACFGLFPREHASVDPRRYYAPEFDARAVR